MALLSVQMTSKKIKQKNIQPLQLSVTEHFNKTILRIVLLILFTPYQEMIYPLSSHIQLHNQGFFFVYSGSDSDTISVAPHKNRIELNIR